MKQRFIALPLIIILAVSAVAVVDLTTARTTTAAATRTATTLDLHVQQVRDSYVFYGSLSKTQGMSGIPHAKITLQTSSDNAHWSTVQAPTTTSSAGAYTFRLPLQPGHTYYYRTHFAGNGQYLSTFSPTVTVPPFSNSEPIPTTLTLRAEKGWNVFVTHYDFYGTLTANGKPIPYANIGIYYGHKQTSGEMLWDFEKVIKTDQAGNYHFSEWYYFRDTYYYRTWFEGPSEFPEYAEAYSPTVIVDI